VPGWRRALAESATGLDPFETGYGDHLCDAAWLLYWWRWYPDRADIDIRAEPEAHWDVPGANWYEVAQNARQVIDPVDASVR
jgi:hypothetical protein